MPTRPGANAAINTGGLYLANVKQPEAAGGQNRRKGYLQACREDAEQLITYKFRPGYGKNNVNIQHPLFRAERMPWQDRSSIVVFAARVSKAYGVEKLNKIPQEKALPCSLVPP